MINGHESKPPVPIWRFPKMGAPPNPSKLGCFSIKFGWFWGSPIPPYLAGWTSRLTTDQCSRLGTRVRSKGLWFAILRKPRGVCMSCLEKAAPAVFSHAMTGREMQPLIAHERNLQGAKLFHEASSNGSLRKKWEGFPGTPAKNAKFWNPSKSYSMECIAPNILNPDTHMRF